MPDIFDIPDFSGDDFANDKQIQKDREAEKAYRKMVADSLSVVQDKLRVVKASHKNLKTFFMFKNLEATIILSFKSSNPNIPLYVSLAEYTSSISTGKLYNHGTDKYLFGYFTMSKIFPRTYICKETIREKITDLFLQSDVDFDHSKIFSRKFHVITENKNRLLDLLQFKELDKLSSFPDMEIELQENACLFRSSRFAISTKEANIFSNLAEDLIKIFDACVVN